MAIRILTRLNDPRVTLLCFCSCPFVSISLQPKAKTGSAKKPAAAPYSKGKATKAPKNPLFEKRPRNFGIGKFPFARHLDVFPQLSSNS